MSQSFLRKRARLLLAVSAIVSLTQGSSARPQTAPSGAPPAKAPSALSRVELDASSRLKVKTIRDVTVKLAAPAMEGRGTAQPGGDRAARYLADRFAKIGLKPKGDAETYLQAIPFRIETALQETTFKAGDSTLKYKDEFVVEEPFPTAGAEISASLVFVGYAITSMTLKRDDFAGLDVKGKFVVVLGGKPGNVGDEGWLRSIRARGFIYRLQSRGAAGVVLLYDPSVEIKERPYSLEADYLSRRRVDLVRGPGVTVAPVIIVNPDAAEKLFAGSGISFLEAKQRAEAGEFVSRDLGKQGSLSVRVKVEQGTGSNVIGVVEGSDATLKNEAVVYTAHYDAYGIEADGTIYPGAADNSLGVGKLLATAEVFAKMKPRARRSIVFIAFTGEEYGRLGAVYWLRRPTWPLEKVAANINYDGLGTDVWGKLAQIPDLGFGYSELGAVMAEVAAASNVAIVPDEPGARTMFRSDSYEFLMKGIPALFLKGQPQTYDADRQKRWDEDYHMPTDIVRPDWEWDGARALSVVGLVVGMRIANADAMPAWLKGSPYNRPRGTDLPPPPR